MQTTPNYGFAIPNADDSDLMDADLWRTPITQIDTRIKTNNDALVARVNKLDTTIGPQVDVSSKFVAAAGFSMSNVQAIKVGNMCQIYIAVTRTGADLAAGNIANIDMCTCSDTKYQPVMATGLAGASSGPVASAYFQTNTVSLAALAHPVPTGTVLDFTATYFCRAI